MALDRQDIEAFFIVEFIIIVLKNYQLHKSYIKVTFLFISRLFTIRLIKNIVDYTNKLIMTIEAQRNRQRERNAFRIKQYNI